MERDTLRIRQAGREDLARLIDLYQHLTPGDERVDAGEGVAILARLTSLPGSAVFVAEIGPVLVGSCTLVVVPNLTRGGRPYGLVENVVTHCDFRKRGIGREALRAATEAAWNAGFYKVMLLTGSDDPATLKFYRDVGFEQSKTGFQTRRIPARAMT
jgi:ribosomal protein S18 acetylase RimI-like enzyme